MYYGHYNNNGIYLGFYLPEFHGINIPTPNIKLTETEWQEALTGEYKVVDSTHTYALPPGPILYQLKETKKKQTNTIRNAKEQGVFFFDGKAYNCDKDSVQRISIAAQNALAAKILGMLFEITWKLADNSTVTLDADGMLGVAQALAAHGETVHAIATQLKEQIEAATTTEELEAITWPAE